MSLTQLNNDCLREVFLHLSEDDLLNISHTNKSLIAAAEGVFSTKFGSKAFVVPDADCTYAEKFMRYVDEDLNYFVCQNALQSLRMLRCFGGLISKIVFWSGDYYDKLSLYVNRYCNKSLTEIRFRKISKDLFTHFDKPFAKVTTVHIYDSVLEGQKGSSDLNDFFPNMRSLALGSVAIHGAEQNFPHLQRLELHGEKCEPTILHSNPQIQTFICKTCRPLHHIRIAYLLQDLQSLVHLGLPIKDNMIQFNGDKMKIPMLEHLEIDYFGQNRKYPTIPIVCDRLSEMTLVLRHPSNITPLFGSLRNSNTSAVIKLNMEWRRERACAFDSMLSKQSPATPGKASKVAQEFPSLQQLSFVRIIPSSENITVFGSICKNLNIFRFKLTNEQDLELCLKVFRTLKNQWQYSVGGYEVILKRIM